MSRTFRKDANDKIIKYARHIERQLDEEYDKIRKEFGFHVAYNWWKDKRKEYNIYPAINYSRSPSHWNHDFHTVPRRAKERILCKKILKGDVDLEDVVFPLHTKPNKYYW